MASKSRFHLDLHNKSTGHLPFISSVEGKSHAEGMGCSTKGLCFIPPINFWMDF